MSSKQLNVELPAELATRVKVDAVKHGVPLNEFARIAFEQFLARPIDTRRTCLATSKRKITGRKVTV